MQVEEWKSQIRRGTLEFCVLLMVAGRDRYGYEIISELERRPILAAGESTVYPLLRRLMKEGHLSSYWRASAQGVPPRKYYAVTDQGREYLQAMSREWDNLLAAMEDIKGE